MTSLQHRDLCHTAWKSKFLKNMAMTGGFLLLAKSGAPGFSVDGLLASRKSMDRHDKTASPRASAR
jgi:hypothetical protein